MALVILTDECNLSCVCCFRPRQAAHATTPWSFAELEASLDGLVAIGESFVGYSGGEPSTWRDGRAGLADVLAATARRGLSPMVVTNGHPFRHRATTSALLDRYFDLTRLPLRLNVSVDRWHDGTWVDARSPALDALLRWRDACTEPPPLQVTAVSLSCLDEGRNIRPEEFAEYTEAGIALQYLPLSPRASPQTLNPIAPKLSPTGTDKDQLGDYGEITRQHMGLSEEEWSTLENSKLFGPCSAGDTLTLDLDRNWWLCCDRAHHTLRVATAGQLTPEAVAACFARNPLVSSFRQDGLLDTLRRCDRETGLLPRRVAKAALARCHAYGISGRASCGLCTSLPEDAFT
jgi:hypothetical protein